MEHREEGSLSYSTVNHVSAHWEEGGLLRERQTALA